MGLEETVAGGGLLLASLIALAAGLVSFLSPCVLPLIPGYLAYVSGIADANASVAANPAAGCPFFGTACRLDRRGIHRTGLLSVGRDGGADAKNTVHVAGGCHLLVALANHADKCDLDDGAGGGGPGAG